MAVWPADPQWLAGYIFVLHKVENKMTDNQMCGLATSELSWTAPPPLLTSRTGLLFRNTDIQKAEEIMPAGSAVNERQAKTLDVVLSGTISTSTVFQSLLMITCCLVLVKEGGVWQPDMLHKVDRKLVVCWLFPQINWQLRGETHN